MATYRITAPDGGQYEITAPDDATQEQVMAYAKANYQQAGGGQQQQPQSPNTPAVVSAGRAIMDLPRQAGLTARAGLRGLAQGAEIITEPIRQIVTDPLLGALGLPKGKPLGQMSRELSDSIGLPQPRGATERVIQDASSMMAGAGGMVGGARALAGATTGVAKTAAQALASHPLGQLLGASGGGAGQGAVREAGGNDLAQAGGAMVGGLTVPALGVGAGRALSATGHALTSTLRPQLLNEAVEQQVRLKLENVGIDWAQLGPRVKQGLLVEARSAMRTGGQLDGDALRRLVDFRNVAGATPTRGMLSLDPVQITRERNLAKMGANATDSGLQGLARAENQNNQALINSLNELGAGAPGASDTYAAGGRAMTALQSGLDRQRGEINQLYSAARDSQGRSFPLNGAAFTSAANKALDDALLGGALPPSVAQHMNRIAAGEVPFTVDYAEQLKTAIGNLQRASSDGQTRMALGVVRRALDETPVLGLGQQSFAPGTRAVNPGNLPSVPGATGLGEDAISAFNRARSANRAMMQRIESSPALTALYRDNAAPDDFIRKFVIGSGAKVDDVARLAGDLRDHPGAFGAVRNNISAWLKEQSIGKGTNDEVAKFSASGYRRALDTIGERKLAVFFTPGEVAQMRSVGRVADYMTAQPAGSAVNNSNSGALVLGRGADMLDTLASKVPLFGLGPTITGVIRGQQQRQALQVPPGLLSLQRPEKSPGGLLAPAVQVGGLLSTPIAE